jgi:hypothetical protein
MFPACGIFSKDHTACARRKPLKNSHNLLAPAILNISKVSSQHVPKLRQTHHSFTSAVLMVCQNPKRTTHTRTYRDATCYSVVPRRKRLYRLPSLYSAAKGLAGSSAVILWSARTVGAPSELHGNTQNSVQLNSCQNVS